MSLSLSGDGTVTGVTAIGDVSSTELGYLDGVTSALQTQINTKADASTQGLVLIDEESFSAVSSVSLNNVFSATYANYRIVVFLSSVSAGQEIFLKFRNGGTDRSDAQYLQANRALTDGGTLTSRTGAGQTTGMSIGFTNASHTFASSFDVYNPLATQRAVITGLTFGHNSAAGDFCGWRIAGKFNHASTSDGFSIIASTGTMTGNVRVYGYKGA